MINILSLQNLKQATGVFSERARILRIMHSKI